MKKSCSVRQKITGEMDSNNDQTVSGNDAVSAGSVVVKFFRIIGKIMITFVWIIYRLCVYLCNSNSEKEDGILNANELRPVRKTSITPHLCLREVEPNTIEGEDGEGSGVPKPLVLFFPWVMAPTKPVNRYCDIYHQKGWDVLTVQGKMKHFMWPPQAIAMAQEIITYLTHNESHMKRPIIIHGMSIGAYIYTVLLMELQKRPKLHEKLKSRIQGQVFDSIVIGGLEKMGVGIATTLSGRSFFQSVIMASVKVYLRMTRRHTVEFYNLAVATFMENPMKCSSLFLYSEDDPMSDPVAIRDLIDNWTNSGTAEIMGKSWLSSPHAGHLRQNPAEYVTTLDTFLRKIGVDKKTE